MQIAFLLKRSLLVTYHPWTSPRLWTCLSSPSKNSATWSSRTGLYRRCLMVQSPQFCHQISGVFLKKFDLMDGLKIFFRLGNPWVIGGLKNVWRRKKFKSSLGGESSCQQPVGAVCSFQSVKGLDIEDGTSDMVWIDDVITRWYLMMFQSATNRH